MRESLFNILRERVSDRLVIDLFAGTGALGLEALSRGASRAIFVEQNRDNVALIHRNLATLRYEDRGKVVATDAYRWARSHIPEVAEPIVVMLDPPYKDYEVRVKHVRGLLDCLSEKLAPGSLIVVESGRTLDEGVLPDLEAWDVRRYGGTQVAFRTVGPEEERSAPGDEGDRAEVETNHADA